MNTNFQKCPECESESLYRAAVNSGGGYGPMLLPGLGSFLTMAQFKVILCGNCGLTRFYAEPSALAKLPKARAWRRVQKAEYAMELL